MKDSGIKFTLEPIAVCDELTVPSLETRKVNAEDVTRQRKVYDSNIADHVQKINAALRQMKMEEYTEPRANSPLRLPDDDVAENVRLKHH